VEEETSSQDYQYDLSVPGEIAVPEIGSIICARLVPAGEHIREGYNVAALLDRTQLAPQLMVRNWRPGDRFLPAKTRAPRKVKELLQAGRLGQRLTMAEKKAWPVVESAGEIVWMRGFTSPERFSRIASEESDGIVIEEVRFHSGTEE
jgi:tRNA(Ile)-lysidine synthase